MEFVKATKSQARARMAIDGPSGSGKTYTALLIASGIIDEMGEGRIAVIDTEHGSASKYADLFDFDTLNGMTEYSPMNYSKAIKAAENAGYKVIIIDSLTHAWAGKGGALEMKDNISARSRSGNSYTAWREVTPHHNQLIEDMLGSTAHIIATMRSKTEYVQEKDERGKTRIRRVGLKPIQRDGVEFEFDICGSMDRNHVMMIDKTRWNAVDNFRAVPDADFGRNLARWLSDGDPVVKSGTPEQDQFDHTAIGESDLAVAALLSMMKLPNREDLTEADYRRLNETIDKFGAGVFQKAVEDSIPAENKEAPARGRLEV